MLRTFCAAALFMLGFSATTSSAIEFRSLDKVGAGKHSHRFVLRDPVTGAPMPGARYRLFLKDHEIPGTPSGDGIVWGVSDSKGQTANVRLPKRYAWSEWVLLPVAGNGDTGAFFSLATPDGSELAGQPYVMSAKGSYLYCGKTSNRGETAYVMSPTETPVVLYSPQTPLSEKDFAWCKRGTEAVAKLAAPFEPAEVFQTLFESYEGSKNEISPALSELVHDKLLELAIDGRNSEQLDAMLSLGEFDKNNIGYELVNANWMVERGMSLIDEALAREPDNPWTLDSKGWALYRLNKPESALTFLDRSISAFEGRADEDVIARAVGLVHRGEVLWQLGRHEEARRDFLAARELDADDETLYETLSRLEVELESDEDDSDVPNLSCPVSI